MGQTGGTGPTDADRTIAAPMQAHTTKEANEGTIVRLGVSEAESRGKGACFTKSATLSQPLTHSHQGRTVLGVYSVFLFRQFF